MKEKIILKTSDAVAYFGNKVSLAEALGVTKQAVSAWGENVPEQSAWPLFYITEGKIKAKIDLPESVMKI